MNAKIDFENLTQDHVMVLRPELKKLMALCNEMERAFLELNVLFASIGEVSECYKAQTLGDLGASHAEQWRNEWAEKISATRVHISKAMAQA